MNRLWLPIFMVVIFNACSVEEGSSGMESVEVENTIQSSGSDTISDITSNTDSNTISDTNNVVISTTDTTTDIVKVDDETQTESPPTLPEELVGLGS